MNHLHEPARRNMALALVHRPSDGHVFVAYENLMIDGFEIVEIAPDGTTVTAYVGTDNESVSLMTVTPDGDLLIAPNDHCELITLHDDGPWWHTLPCDHWQDPVKGLAASETGLLVSIGGTTQKVLLLEWDDLTTAEDSIALPNPGLIAGHPERFVVQSDTKLFHWDDGTSELSTRTYSNVVGLHTASDGLFVTYARSSRHLAWYDEVEWTSQKVLLRPSYMSHAVRVEKDMYFINSGLWRIDGDRVLSLVDADVKANSMTEAPGGDLFIASTDGDILRYDPKERSATTLLDGADHSIDSVYWLVAHKGQIYFSYRSGAEYGLASVDFDGSKLRSFVDPIFDYGQVASNGDHICHTSDFGVGVWCFDPSRPWGDDVEPADWIRVTKPIAYMFTLAAAADGALFSIGDYSLLEFQGEEVLVFPTPHQEWLESIVGEDAHGRVVVTFISYDGSEHGIGYFYR